ncbi:hypothetical protein AC96_4383 [Escherichia coli 2-156-04_S4_C2]|nr:hypothetical protein L912_3224 [Escherichia coli SCD1]KDX22822.1 hypothetical protein AC96_4383 [Escherichia coli 2-156-04_S4_C2]
MLVPDVAYPASKFNRLQFYRWPDKHSASGITDLFFRPIKNAPVITDWGG